jgi:hypothetical protein
VLAKKSSHPRKNRWLRITSSEESKQEWPALISPTAAAALCAGGRK